MDMEQVARDVKQTEEKDNISGLDEIATGIDTGVYKLQHSLGSLQFAGTDLVANTDFMSRFEKIMEKEGTLVNRPETWRGEVISLLTQFGIPGVTIAKIMGRIPAVVKMKKAADAVKGGKLRKEEFWFPEEWQAYKFKHHINNTMEAVEVNDFEDTCENGIDI